MKDYVVTLRLASTAGEANMGVLVKASSVQQPGGHDDILMFYDDKCQPVAMFREWLHWTIKQ